MTRLDAWVDRHGWSIVVGLLTAGGLWATNTAAMGNKAEKADLAKLAAVVAEKADVKDITAVAHDVAVLKYLACKEHPNDSVCNSR